MAIERRRRLRAKEAAGGSTRTTAKEGPTEGGAISRATSVVTGSNEAKIAITLSAVTRRYETQVSENARQVVMLPVVFTAGAEGLRSPPGN